MSIMDTLPIKRAVVFGAGNMACGLLGELLYESGYHTTFIARRREIVDSLNTHEGYLVGIAGETDHWIRVRKCQAVSSQDTEASIEAVATADIVFTAVGIDNLPVIAPLVAEGLWRRAERRGGPLNVIASENLPGTGAYLRHKILDGSSADKAMLLDKTVGFSAALTHRIMTGGESMDGILHFTVDVPGDLIIDSRGLVEPLPIIYHAVVSDNFDAMFLGKLSTINLAQAVAAYIGHRYGCKYVHEAASHPMVAPTVRSALAESVAAFKAEFPELGRDVEHDAEEALLRIADPGLNDTIARIAKGPQRKLAAQERLLGPTRLAERHNLPYENLAKTIAAALAYHDEHDIQSRTMQYVIGTDGVDKILTEVCGMLPHERLAQNVKRQWANLTGKGTGAFEIEHDDLLAEVISAVGDELIEKYDPELVRNVMDRVVEDFHGARISSFLATLVKKRACEYLKENSEQLLAI